MCLPLTDLGNPKINMDLLEKNAWKKNQKDLFPNGDFIMIYSDRIREKKTI